MDNLNNKNIAVIGAGHMGKAMIQGFLQSGFADKNLFVSNSAGDNKKVAAQADWILLVVKPLLVQAVLTELADLTRNKIIISAAAGVAIAKIATYVENPNQKIIRIMPNIPAAYNAGVIGLFANTHVSQTEKAAVTHSFAALGTIIDCKEEDALDAITILSGSGPALAAYCIAMLTHAGESYGFPKETAETIAIQTFHGTITYLQKTSQSASALQDAVATKGGVTEQIIKQLNDNNLSKLFIQSLQVGYDRIMQLKKEF